MTLEIEKACNPEAGNAFIAQGHMVGYNHFGE